MKNNFKYAFVLGHVPELSRLEIQKVLNAKRVSFTELFYHPEILILETTTELSADNLQRQLGGTIKIAAINLLTAEPRKASQLLEMAVNIYKIRQETSNKGGKFQFGFSFYGGSPCP